jgi:hypothetical protein
VRARAARAAFDRALDEITAEMEQAAGLTPSSEGIYELIQQVIRLRRAGEEGDPPPSAG